jgi:UDP-N-acetylglucosamine diphosphorylase / glucose-1-phosphate thymidylyltransferase / UDP-N-acetylgalactosamine diphosphorylase / glucosamine-1-phosphate N-acetyltransferase / galactosamine-1-phosphate N-acetyltransferase
MIVIMAMAGRGKRFADKGFETPKPLIKVNGKPMFLWAVKSLENVNYSKIIFIALKEHEQNYNLKKLIEENINSDFELILLDDVTEGQLVTVLKAERFLDTDEDMMVCASDSYIKSEIQNDIKKYKDISSGIISVINLPGTHWSFAKMNNDGWVEQVAEKDRISDNASTGIYYFSNAGEFKKYGTEIVQNKETTKGEYYVIPVYQKMINDGKKIAISVAEEMWDMGTPDSKQNFEQYLNSNLA